MFFLQHKIEPLILKDDNVRQRVYKDYIFKDDPIMNEKIEIAKSKLNFKRTFNILKNSFDNDLSLLLFGEPFDDQYVWCVLQSKPYICFLIKSHMINRVYDLKENKYTAFLIRFYLSILKFR